MAEGHLKVLIVDDEPSVVHALGVLFDLHGIAHVSAASPGAAVERLTGDDVGVVIQDMNFGTDKTSGEDGIHLFRRIHAAHPDVPVLLITAWASLETAVQLVKEGASDYLAKPWDDDKLVLSVQTLLRVRRLQLENRRLREKGQKAREALAARHDLCGLVYESDAMHRLVALAVNVGASNAPVLVTGPSGAGKEKLAEIVQASSARRSAPFVRVNVGALPEELMEAELFGAEAGAYTGAQGRRVGRFEAADRGTLFLDEIDALSLAGQVKLLRVVQSGEYQRLGSSATRKADVRIISASNANLEDEVAQGRFREDLFYRLNVVELAVPPLDQRPEDVLPLARHFVEDEAHDREVPDLSPEAAEALVQHRWPGNVRELQNRMRRAILTASGGVIQRSDLDLDEPARTPSTPPGSAPGPLDAERRRLEQALVDADGVVARAAETLGLSRQALYRKMDRLGIVLERRPRE
ncbi:MAG: sigma-54 dependent transcriptional regulator [Acidobacteriota bacterium]|jgi:DNA-binding NtrC family response regulator